MIEYSELLEEFKEWIETDSNVGYLWELNKAGKATYMHADAYAKGIAAKWSELMTEAYGESIANTEEIAQMAEEIAKSYQKSYSESAYFAKSVQKQINSSAKIGMNPLEPALDSDRVNNLIDKLTSEDTTEEMRKHLIGSQAVESVTRTAVSDTIKANARIQSKAGLHAYIERSSGAGCCKWCDDMAGRYEYPNVPDDVWAVHAGCTCHFIYSPSKNDVSRIHFETNGGKITKITK